MSTHTTRNPERDDEAGEGSKAYVITKPVNPVQLDEELSGEMNWRKDSGLVGEGNPLKASKDSPVTLWVLRSDVDTNTFKAAVSAHKAVSESDEDPLAVLREKARAGTDLDGDEVQQALRVLILRSL